MPTIIIETPAESVTEAKPGPVLLSPQPQRKVTWLSKVWETSWPVLLWLLIPGLWLARLLIISYRIAYVRVFMDRKISTSAKCPACGVRQEHKIQFARDYNAIVHVCGQCTAEWGVAPIQPTSQWLPERAKPAVENSLHEPIAPR